MMLSISSFATGHHPQRDPNTGQLGIRPRDIKPQWAEVPLIYLFGRRFRGLVDVGRRKREGQVG